MKRTTKHVKLACLEPLFVNYCLFEWENFKKPFLNAPIVSSLAFTSVYVG